MFQIDAEESSSDDARLGAIDPLGRRGFHRRSPSFRDPFVASSSSERSRMESAREKKTDKRRNQSVAAMLRETARLFLEVGGDPSSFSAFLGSRVFSYVAECIYSRYAFAGVLIARNTRPVPRRLIKNKPSCHLRRRQ